MVLEVMISELDKSVGQNGLLEQVSHSDLNNGIWSAREPGG